MGSNVDSPLASTLCSARSTPPFSMENVPVNIQRLEYNVRGKVLQRAFEIEKDLPGHHLDRLLRCHIGNPHAVGAPALTYIREILSLILCPKLMDAAAEKSLLEVYKSDSLTRARAYRRAMGEPGAYTHSQGALCLREEISGFFERRDGVRAEPETIFLTNGASDAIHTIISCLIGGSQDCLLLPLPQYPLYTATVVRHGGHHEFYELDEEHGWDCSLASIEAAYGRAVNQGKDVKGIVVIAPGNPAPTVLKEDDIKGILKFAEERQMAVLADEVYQDNVYAVGESFVPFRRVLLENGFGTQLISFHSSSKGYYGECGFRGGMMQLENFGSDALALVYKMRSVELCSNTMGQVCMALVTNPPKPGTPSYNQFAHERQEILTALAQKAKVTHQFFNSLEGVSCQPIKGALYAFPQLRFPPKYVQHCQEAKVAPDLHYCLKLLEATGIVSVPGQAFGQKEGTYHLRLTILPPSNELLEAFQAYKRFHQELLSRF